MSKTELEEKPFEHSSVGPVPADRGNEVQYFGDRKGKEEKIDNQRKSSHSAFIANESKGDDDPAVVPTVHKGVAEKQRKAPEKGHEKSREKGGIGGISREKQQREGEEKGSWLVSGIRVRIVSKKAGGGEGGGGEKAYLKKGVVLDVHSLGVASIRLDDGTILNAIKERHLETVLPGIGGVCLILYGEYKGESAILVEKQKVNETVLLQLTDDLTIISMQMDHTAALL